MASRCIILIFTIIALNVEAKDFGKIGHVFEIREEGFLSMVKRKLQNIDIEKQQQKMINDTKKRIEEPEPITGITKTIENRSFIFDPTYILTEDTTLPNSDVLHKAGTKVNPLDYMDFDRRLFFIDSRDNAQISWLKKELFLAKNTDNIKVILVAGRPLDLSDELAMDIYFDQFGELTKKFGIRQVPATVFQENKEKFLSIIEAKCE